MLAWSLGLLFLPASTPFCGRNLLLTYLFALFVQDFLLSLQLSRQHTGQSCYEVWLMIPMSERCNGDHSYMGSSSKFSPPFSWYRHVNPYKAQAAPGFSVRRGADVEELPNERLRMPGIGFDSPLNVLQRTRDYSSECRGPPRVVGSGKA